MAELRVLIVEDDPAQTELIRLRLEDVFPQHNPEVEMAGTVAAASTQLSDNAYDLIIQDLYMPPFGPESEATIFKAAGNTPILATSNMSTPELHRTATGHGAKAFCSKEDLISGETASIVRKLVPKL